MPVKDGRACRLTGRGTQNHYRTGMTDSVMIEDNYTTVRLCLAIKKTLDRNNKRLIIIISSVLTNNNYMQ